MALMDATRVRVAGIEVVATMRGEGDDKSTTWLRKCLCILVEARALDGGKFDIRYSGKG